MSYFQHLVLLILFQVVDCIELAERFMEGLAQLTFTCSNSTIETVEKGVKYVQS